MDPGDQREGLAAPAYDIDQEPVLTPRREAIARATAWTLSGFLLRRLGEAALLVVIGLTIAREDYGRFTSWKAILPPLYILVAGGWDTVLLRRRHSEAIHTAMLAFWSAASSVVLAVALIFGAGWLSRWYRDPGLAFWFQVGGLSLFFHGVTRVIRTVLARQLNFGELTRWEIIRMGIWGIGVVSIALGPGSADVPSPDRVARLIIFFLCAELVETVGLLVVGTGGRRLKELIDKAREAPLSALRWRVALKREKRFCSIITIDALFNALSVGLPIYLVGRFLDGNAVALFAYGFQFVQIPLFVVLDSVNRVMLPGLSGVDRRHLPDRAGEVVRILSVATLPILLWAFASAPMFFTFLFGPDWYDAGMVTRCLTLYLLLAPMTNISGAIEAITDRPEVGLIWNIVTLIGRGAILWFGLQWMGLLGGMICYGAFSLAMWAFYQHLIARMLEIPTKRWLANYLGFTPVWAFMLGFWWWFWPYVHLEFSMNNLSRMGELGLLILGGAIGMVLYLLLLTVFHSATLKELLRLRHAWRKPSAAIP